MSLLSYRKYRGFLFYSNEIFLLLHPISIQVHGIYWYLHKSFDSVCRSFYYGVLILNEVLRTQPTPVLSRIPETIFPRDISGLTVELEQYCQRAIRRNNLFPLSRTLTIYIMYGELQSISKKREASCSKTTGAMSKFFPKFDLRIK